MSALAQVLAHDGISVSGSDRDYDSGANRGLFRKLEVAGVKLCKQDGSAIDGKIKKVIISKAVETDNPDISAAVKLKIPVSYRQEELKKIFKNSRGIAVAGTCGKTTVVGMIGCVFDSADKKINVINGGVIKNYADNNRVGNVRMDTFPYTCVETDESEGDLKGYAPDIGVITNIGADHMPQEEANRVFNEFTREIKDVLVVNSESLQILKYRPKKVFSFSVNANADITAQNINLSNTCSSFTIDGQKVRLNIPGIHNVYNALAAIGAGMAYGLPLKSIIEGLEIFRGIGRRYDILGEVNGVTVVDDYAHNPEKIRASIQTAKIGGKNVIAVYQPHGYGPLRMFINELAEMFARNISNGDYLFIPDVYYAGGTVNKDISSRNLVEKVKLINGRANIEYIADRSVIETKIKSIARRGDTILIMGARDNTLPEWGNKLCISPSILNSYS